MWDPYQRSSRSSPLPDDSASTAAFPPSGIGRGSSSGATPEPMFVSWHCTHGTVPAHKVLVTTDSDTTPTPPSKPPETP